MEIRENFLPYIIESLTDYYIINDNWVALKENLLQHSDSNIVLYTAEDLIYIYGCRYKDFKYPSYRNYRDCTEETQKKLKIMLNNHLKEFKDCIRKFKKSKDEEINPT